MTISAELQAPLIELLLSLADDKFMLGHRNADWTGLGPILEEDIAFSSIAQDEISHAYAIYDYVARLQGSNPDRVAFGRNPEQYRCAAIVEPPDEFDYGVALARQFFCDHFDALRLARLSNSSETNLAALARRMAAEERIHVEHADSWVQRLAKGGAESKAHTQRSLDRLAPLAASLFEQTRGVEALERALLYPPLSPPMFEQWKQSLEGVAQRANLTLQLPVPQPNLRGGRAGVHTDGFSAMLDELCAVYRLEPEAAW